MIWGMWISAGWSPFRATRHYLWERSRETLGLLYADHFPYLQKKTARGVRRTPFHQHLLDNGAVMGELGRVGTGQLVRR